MVELARMAPPERKPGIITVVETGEPQFPGLLDRVLSADVIVSSDVYSDVFNIPYHKSWGDKFFDMSPPALSNFEGVSAYSGIFVSNCIQPRLDWIKRIGAIIPLVSYGGCAHTAGASCSRNSKCSKVEEASKYPFAIAFENHPMQSGYVSEKLYQAYASNVLPVVWSASNVANYTPGPDTFINAADFETPEELAGYLKKVRSNATLYSSYFKWRHHVSLVQETKAKWNRYAGGKKAVCGICEFVAGRVPT